MQLSIITLQPLPARSASELPPEATAEALQQSSIAAKKLPIVCPASSFSSGSRSGLLPHALAMQRLLGIRGWTNRA